MSRPEQVMLVAVVFATGVAAGTARGGMLTPSVVWAGAALLLATVSVHTINEYADVDTDALTRRTAFSGGSGALHDLGLPPSFALRVAAGTGGAAVLVAVLGWSTSKLGLPSLVLLLVGLAGGWLYSISPIAFSRHGWGEVANALLGGIVLPVYGMAAVQGEVGATDAVLFVPFALLVFVNLLETQWPDRVADAASGKHTLTARLSARSVRAVSLVSASAAYLLVLLLAPDVLPTAVALASMSGLPFSAWGLRRLTRVPTPLPAVLAMVVVILGQGAAWTWLAVR
jgi:1,4-dihydroxy-2-naphthoate octaprenyltransferase